MEHLIIQAPKQSIKLDSWTLQGEGIIESKKCIKDLIGVFRDESACNLMDQDTLVYNVQAHLPVKEGTPGGLYFGTTIIQPGVVGDEYFMTRGHFHATSDRAEYYWGVQGSGMLILMDSDRNTWAEPMFPGSLHYINSHVAHRVANTGNTTLIFGACWPSDAGHNYAEININGFSARLIQANGKPILK
jgi:glucose-6-phosphate isomerase